MPAVGRHRADHTVTITTTPSPRRSRTRNSSTSIDIHSDAVIRILSDGQQARRPLDPRANDGFEVSYVRDDGAEKRVRLARAWAVPFERVVSVASVCLAEGSATSERAVVGQISPRGVFHGEPADRDRPAVESA
jgi:hypothetical protein